MLRKSVRVKLNATLCAIWYHLYNLKNLKNTHGGMLLLEKLQVEVGNLTKSNTPPWVFFILKMVPNCAKHQK